MTSETETHRDRSRVAIATLLLLTGFMLLFPSGALPADAAKKCPLWQAARDTIHSMRPFRAKFTQQVFYGEDLSLEESGDLLFVDNRRMRWTYRSPELKVFLLLGDRYQFYEPEAGQITVGPVDANQKGWIWEMLASSGKAAISDCNAADRSFELREAGEGVRYRVFLDQSHRVLRVEYTDPGGGRQRFLFSDYESGVTVGENDFQLNPPSGTEVIRMDEEAAQQR